MDYSKLKCEICGEKFTENDDVVVCPECGTPAHRKCWKETGECPNKDKHSKDYVFDGFDIIKKSAQGISDDKEENKENSKENDDKIRILIRSAADDAKICPNCGHKNAPNANFCNHCGEKLEDIPVREDFDFAEYGELKLPPGMPDPLGGVAASEKFEDDISAADMACYVAVNTPYYMKAFRAVKRKSNRFNISAAIFSGVWFFFRKQYKVGALVFSIETLLYVLRYYLSITYSLKVMNSVLDKLGLSMENMSSFTMEQYMKMSAEMQKLPASQQILAMMPSILLFVQIIGMIILGVFANRIYYSHCVKRIRTLKSAAAEENLTKAETAQLLNLSGGVNIITTGLLLLVYFFMFFS